MTSPDFSWIPRAIESEQQVLGAALMNPRTLGDIWLTESDFFDHRHRAIWRALKVLEAGTQPYDVVLVGEELQDAGELEDAGGAEYLAELVANATGANLAPHCRAVRDKRQLREIVGICEDGLTAIRDRAHAADVLERLQSQLAELTTVRNTRSVMTAQQMLAETFRNIEGEYEGTIEGGLPTGLVDLDGLLNGGLRPGTLTIIGGRPSMGKSTLAAQIGRHVARDHRVLDFTLEDANDQRTRRHLSALCDVPFSILMSPRRMRDEHWPKLSTGSKQFAQYDYSSLDLSGLSIQQIKSYTRKAHASAPLSLVIVDYLDLMTKPEGERLADQLGEISKSLKNLAKELDTRVILVCQLNRGLEQRTNKRPILADLRNSGELEQDADVVLFVYRDEVYRPNCLESRGTAELIVAKQRNGPIGSVTVRADFDYCRFQNFARQEYETAA